MSQDVMFLVLSGLIVVASLAICPVLVVWQYQRLGTVASRDKEPENRSDWLPVALISTPSQILETHVTPK